MADDSNRKHDGGHGDTTRKQQQKDRLSHPGDKNSGPDTHAGTQNPAGGRIDEERQQHDPAEKNSEHKKESGHSHT